MPYMIVKHDDKYCVHKKEGEEAGEQIACHDTEEQAKEQMAALYANEESKMGLTDTIDKIYRDYDSQYGLSYGNTVESWIVSIEESTVIIKENGTYYRVPFGIGEDGDFSFYIDKKVEVEPINDWIEKSKSIEMQKVKQLDPENTLVHFGGEVKMLAENKVGGYLVRFSTESDPDLEGDFFTKDTEFGTHKTSMVFYHHGADRKVQKRILADDAELKIDDVGVWVESQLKMRDEYEEWIMELAKQGKLGWSSGTAGHLVEREPVGKAYWIKSWPLGLDASLTPTPAEPRNSAMSLKSLLTAEANQQGQAMSDGKEEADTIETKEVNKIMDETKVETVVKETPVEQKTVDLDYEKLASMVAEKLDPVMPAKSVNIVKEENRTVADPYKALTNWMRGGKSTKGLGDLGAKVLNDQEIEFGSTKAALQEGTASEGGNLVPNDFYAGIIAKRDQMSIPRRAGARVFRTSRDVLDIPYEDTSMTNFVLTAEEGAYDQNEPTFGNAQAIVYKYTKLVKVSEELVEDEDANLDSFLSDAFGRAWGLTENAIALVGTGSSQPQGVFVGGSVGYTFADTNSITAAEIPLLYWALGEPYHEGAVWVTKGSTMAALQGLTGNNFQLVSTPPGGDLSDSMLWGKPIFTSDSCAAATTGLKSIIFGNWNFYALVEKGGLVIQRNPYLYQGNGQIGVFAKIRTGGIVLQSEAFKWGIQA